MLAVPQAMTNILHLGPESKKSLKNIRDTKTLFLVPEL